MADIDYGYGDATPDAVDYGYGDAAPEPIDYGYGDSHNTDYGYGATSPDYGYGDAPTDYGYGDVSTDYGYGDAAPAPPVAPAARKPKRRCSVTKYSLVSSAPEPPKAHDYGYEEVEHRASTLTADTSATASNDGHEEHLEKHHEHVKKGMMSKVRKRLSIF
jgi:hypothetical protein